MFDIRTIGASLETARNAQRVLDDARVGFGAADYARSALDAAKVVDTSIADLGTFNDARMNAFDAARSSITGIAEAGAGLEKATGGLGAAALASATVQKPAISFPKPTYDLGIEPPLNKLNELFVPPVGTLSQAAEAYRHETAGIFSPLLDANRPLLLGVVQKLAEINMPPIVLSEAQRGWATALTSASMGRSLFDGLESSGVFNALRTLESASADLFRFSGSLAPYTDSLARAAQQWMQYAVFQPDWMRWGMLGTKALEALEALDSGRHWIADAFLKGYLRLYPTPERREALWKVLKKGFEDPLGSPPPWLTLNQERATAYLKAAVYKEAERIRRDREMKDRLWWRKVEEMPLSLDAELGNPPATEDPALIVTRRTDDRTQVLEMLCADGTARDKEIARLILEGEHDRADIRNLVGSANLQSFERKARSWRAKKLRVFL